MSGAWMVAAAVCGSLATAAAGAAGLSYLTRPIRRLASLATEFLVDWRGEPARDGVPERPGVMVRLARIETRMGAVEDRISLNGFRPGEEPSGSEGAERKGSS